MILQGSLRARNRTRLEMSRSDAENQIMTPQELDFAFPFLVFSCGFLLVLVHEIPVFSRLGQERLDPGLWEGLQKRRPMAWICFFVGGLWSLQNLWIG